MYAVKQTAAPSWITKQCDKPSKTVLTPINNPRTNVANCFTSLALANDLIIMGTLSTKRGTRTPGHENLYFDMGKWNIISQKLYNVLKCSSFTEIYSEDNIVAVTWKTIFWRTVEEIINWTEYTTDLTKQLRFLLVPRLALSTLAERLYHKNWK